MTSSSMTGTFHNPFKSWSPLNKIFFPGESWCHSYDETGKPYAGNFTCLGGSYTCMLLWTPDYHIAGRSAFNREVEIGSREGILPCTKVNAEIRRRPVMYIQRNAGAKYVVLYTHGNGCDVGEMQPTMIELAARWEAHVIMPEYPGYGAAPGRASVKDVEWAVMSAALFTLKELMKDLKVPNERLIVFGYSIGSGAACMLARALCEMDMSPACLMLHAPYTSLRGMAVEVAGPVGNIVFNRFKTKKNLPYITAPVMIFHGDRDEVIPFRMGQENAASRDGCPYKTELFLQRGCTHGEFNGNEHLYAPGLSFLQRNVKGYLTATPLPPMRFKKEYKDVPEEMKISGSARTVSQKKRAMQMAAVGGCVCGAMCIEAICGSAWLLWRFVKRTVVKNICPTCVKTYNLHIKQRKVPEWVEKKESEQK